MRGSATALTVLLCLASPAFAQQGAIDSDIQATPLPLETVAEAPQGDLPNIADLRADLDALSVDLQSLRVALRVSGAAGYANAGGASVIERMDRIEAELRRLTGVSEKARKHIEEITQDGIHRLDDLEFRLCQLEDHCDLAALTAQGGSYAAGPKDISLGTAGIDDADHPAMIASTQERSDFDAAQALAESGEHAAAALAFGQVAIDHAGGPLFAEARFREGQELLATGDWRNASRAWTDVFSADPAGPRAPESLLGVAEIMAEENQTRPACLFLLEVMTRYSDPPQLALPRLRDTAALYNKHDCEPLLHEPLPAFNDTGGSD